MRETRRMRRMFSHARIFAISALLLSLFAGSVILHAETDSATDKYANTRSVLEKLYVGEVHAKTRYSGFSETALKEGHKNIAHMFKAIANSESVHATNFKRILGKLGVTPPEVDLSDIEIETTKQNLRYASDVELAEIDTEYPEYLKLIGSEDHQEAIKYIRYAWDAERQHRELIKEIQGGTGIFYSVLLDRFKESPGTYYVNQNCGATVHEPPKKKCPVCHFPADTYIEIPAP